VLLEEPCSRGSALQLQNQGLEVINVCDVLFGNAFLVEHGEVSLLCIVTILATHVSMFQLLSLLPRSPIYRQRREGLRLNGTVVPIHHLSVGILTVGVGLRVLRMEVCGFEA